MNINKIPLLVELWKQQKTVKIRKHDFAIRSIDHGRSIEQLPLKNCKIQRKTLTMVPFFNMLKAYAFIFTN